jgi:signal transduction histidine kinase
MRKRLFWSLVLVAVVTMSIGGVAAAILINRSVEHSARDEFIRQAEATAELIETSLGQGALEGQGDRPVIPMHNLGQLLAIVRLVGGHDYVEASVVGPRGVVSVVGTDSVLVDQVPGGVAELEGRVEFTAEVDGEQVAAYAFALPSRPLGTVIVVIGTDLQLVPWTDVLVSFLWAIVLGVVLAALLAGYLSRFLAKRLHGLRDASRRLATGDLSARVPLDRKDEIGEVAEAFNEMGSQLEDARRREREFLASVGHDLRTPLTTLSGYGEALAEGRVPEEELPRVASVIQRESGRLGRLVEDLMLLSRIESREFSLRPEKLDLSAHLRGTIEAFRNKADEAGVTLEADLASVPEAAVDPDRFDQVVGNLVENALRYTPAPGRVRVVLTEEEGYARIAVSDTGAGIEPDHLPHIFERLYQAQHYRPVRAEGSGLGLSIVAELARAMGGAAEADSEPGRGTTVSVIVPLAPPPA